MSCSLPSGLPKNNIVVRIKPSFAKTLILPRFLYYYFTHLQTRGFFEAIMSGTAQQFIRVRDVGGIRMVNHQGYGYKLREIAEIRKDTADFEPDDIVLLRVGTGDTIGKAWFVGG